MIRPEIASQVISEAFDTVVTVRQTGDEITVRAAVRSPLGAVFARLVDPQGTVLTVVTLFPDGEGYAGSGRLPNAGPYGLSDLHVELVSELSPPPRTRVEHRAELGRIWAMLALTLERRGLRAASDAWGQSAGYYELAAADAADAQGNHDRARRLYSACNAALDRMETWKHDRQPPFWAELING